MAKELKHIPNIRFPEFKNSGEWELKALSKITSSIFDGTHQTPQYVDKGVPFFSVENLVSNAKNRFISQDDYNIATAKNKPEKGDILLTRIGNIGFSSIVSWDYDFSIYVTLACIKSSSSFNSYFLHSFSKPIGIKGDYKQVFINCSSMQNKYEGIKVYKNLASSFSTIYKGTIKDC